MSHSSGRGVGSWQESVAGCVPVICGLPKAGASGNFQVHRMWKLAQL